MNVDAVDGAGDAAKKIPLTVGLAVLRIGAVGFHDHGAESRDVGLRFVVMCADEVAAAFGNLASCEGFLREKSVRKDICVALLKSLQTQTPTRKPDEILAIMDLFVNAELARQALLRGVEIHLPELSGLNPNPIEYDWPDGRMQQIADELRNLARRARELRGREASVATSKNSDNRPDGQAEGLDVPDQSVGRSPANQGQSAEDRTARAASTSGGGDVVVMWEGALHTERNVRLARTRSAYLEAHGSVRHALEALKLSGYPIAKSTFYNHLEALDAAIPKWRASVQLSNPDGNLDGMRFVGTRKKPRGK